MNGFKVVAMTLFLVIWGCSKGEEEHPAKESPLPVKNQTSKDKAGYRTVPVKNGGTISGKVLFTGKWTPVSVPVTKDQAVCGKRKQDSSLIVNRSGEVRYAVVHITDIQMGKSVVDVKPVLDQRGCEYEPHVLAFPVGTTVEILNSDGILHNVHSFSQKNRPFNKAQPKYLKKITRAFDQAEFISVKCDVHSWMSAWFFVADNPYYDVTSDRGSFELEEVPPGDYTLEVWHESLGTQRRRVTVGPNERVEVRFEYSTPVN